MPGWAGQQAEPGRDRPGSLVLCSWLSGASVTWSLHQHVLPWCSCPPQATPSSASSSFTSFLTRKAELGKPDGLLWVWLLTSVMFNTPIYEVTSPAPKFYIFQRSRASDSHINGNNNCTENQCEEARRSPSLSRGAVRKSQTLGSTRPCARAQSTAAPLRPCLLLPPSPGPTATPGLALLAPLGSPTSPNPCLLAL